MSQASVLALAYRDGTVALRETHETLREPLIDEATEVANLFSIAFPSLSEAVAGPKKKQPKPKSMPLGEFMKDTTTGAKPIASWADDPIEDLPTGPTGQSGYRDGSRGPSSYDGGRDGYEGDSRSQRPKQPVPNRPPYTAYVGNLPYEIHEEAIKEFFQPLKIKSVRLTKDRDTGKLKGFGYVEFEDRESLEQAVADGGAELDGRRIRIDVAEPKDRPTDDRTTSDWRSNRPERIERRPTYDYPRRDDHRGERDFGRDREHGPNREGGFGRDFGRDRAPQRSSTMPEPATSERKKLVLAPRTSQPTSPNSPEAPAVTTAAPVAPAKKKSDPFGGARPVDVSEIERKAEERLKLREEELRKKSEEEKRKREEEEAAKKKDLAAKDAAAAPVAHEARLAAAAGSWRAREGNGPPARREAPFGGERHVGAGRGGGSGRGGSFGRGDGGFGRGGGGGGDHGPKRDAPHGGPPRNEGGAWRGAGGAVAKAIKPEGEGEEKVVASNKYDLLHDGDE
ncbi:hypothetical protein HDU93_000572 [Gonapodya sp. JEL0774]|nr:hypothetical protein HDU93_000572 [Gonapodya sp. JEL0774]